MVRIAFTFYLTLFSLIYDCNGGSTKKLKTHLTSIKCANHPSEFNLTSTCGIKPFRNGTQLLTISMNFHKSCNDLWLHVMFFFKFGGTTQYRPWLFNSDESMCDYFDERKTHSLWFGFMIEGVNFVAPNHIHKCPYFGEEGVKAVELDAMIAHAIPHVLPTGDYRIYFRLHTTTNMTLFDSTIGLHVDAFNPLEAIPMGRR